MVERDTPSDLPASLSPLKRDILDHFDQLPPEHQARVAAVLLHRMFEERQQALFMSTLELLSPAITPEHVHQAGLTKGEIEQLDDEDLTQVVEHIVTLFVHDVIWDDLVFAARKYLVEKQAD